MGDTKPLGWIKTDTERLEHAVKAEKAQQKDGEEKMGLIIIPPLIDDTERNTYPDDYIAYCMDRERKRAILEREQAKAQGGIL